MGTIEKSETGGRFPSVACSNHFILLITDGGIMTLFLPIILIRKLSKRVFPNIGLTTKVIRLKL